MTSGTMLVTGGAGFVGSSLAIHLKQRDPGLRVVALDNLRRRGSELNLPRLRGAGVEFLHGDIRNSDDVPASLAADILLECSAEPSVLAGFSSPAYVIDTNLVGTLNLLEYCRRHGTKIIFLSTSRVYPVEPLCGLRREETESRFELADEQAVRGVSSAGVTEAFPLEGARSIYGATKLASEMFIQEYAYAYALGAVINRCGVLAGPWQMGKIDQGFIALWLARHVYGGELSYIGFNGSGKQVRDVLHIEDLCELVALQLAQFETVRGGVFNVGGGRRVSVSLRELTEACRRVSGKSIPIRSATDGRPADIPVYLSDGTKLQDLLAWRPSRSVEVIVQDTYGWLRAYEKDLRPILSG